MVIGSVRQLPARRRGVRADAPRRHTNERSGGKTPRSFLSSQTLGANAREALAAWAGARPRQANRTRLRIRLGFDCGRSSAPGGCEIDDQLKPDRLPPSTPPAKHARE